MKHGKRGTRSTLLQSVLLYSGSVESPLPSLALHQQHSTSFTTLEALLPLVWEQSVSLSSNIISLGSKDSEQKILI